MDTRELASVVNEYIAARDARRAKDKEAEAMKEGEAKLKATLMEELRKAGAGAIAGSTHTATLVRKMSPQVTDWPALYKHIQETGHFDFLQRRLSPPAVKERWDDNLEVPGVSPIPVEDLSITKL